MTIMQIRQLRIVAFQSGGGDALGDVLQWRKSLRELIEDVAMRCWTLLGSIACGLTMLFSHLILAQSNDAYAAARARLVDTVLKGGGITNHVCSMLSVAPCDTSLSQPNSASKLTMTKRCRLVSLRPSVAPTSWQ